MSWSVYLEDFSNEPVPNQEVTRAVLEPLLDEARFNVIIDGLPTEIYGIDQDPMTGLSFSRLKGEGIWELIYQVAVLTRTAVVPQDGPVCLTDATHLEWVPKDFIDEVGSRIVTSGSDIARVVSEI